MPNAITTTHGLDFEAVPWHFQVAGEPTNICFRVGTCEGLYVVSKTSIDIIAITNSQRGNGHLDDVLEWFEYSCKQNNFSLKVVEIMNKGFYKHLLLKRGFSKIDKHNLIKYFS